MGRLTASLRAAALCLLVAALYACEGTPKAAPEKPPPKVEAPEPEAPPRPRYYDAEGYLLESDESVAGVPLPVGLERSKASRDRHHVYRTGDIPLAKVVAYYGPRLFTGQIDRRGAGVIYRDAIPMQKRNAKVTMDVSILPTSDGAVKVIIHEHALPPLVTPTVQELEKTLRQEQKRLE